MTERSTDPGAVESRNRLLDAAEELFSEQGIDSPSARSIAFTAGHGNSAAVGYHFGDRRGLVSAIVARWAERIDVQRSVALSELELNPPVAPDDAIRTVITPWVESMRSPEGHRRIRLLNQLTHHPMYSSLVLPEFSEGMARASAHIIVLTAHLDPRTRRFRARIAMLMAVTALGLHSTLTEEANPNEQQPLDEQGLIDEIVGMVHALLSAP